MQQHFCNTGLDMSFLNSLVGFSTTKKAKDLKLYSKNFSKTESIPKHVKYFLHDIQGFIYKHS